MDFDSPGLDLQRAYTEQLPPLQIRSPGNSPSLPRLQDILPATQPLSQAIDYQQLQAATPAQFRLPQVQNYVKENGHKIDTTALSLSRAAANSPGVKGSRPAWRLVVAEPSQSPSASHQPGPDLVRFENDREMIRRLYAHGVTQRRTSSMTVGRRQGGSKAASRAYPQLSAQVAKSGYAGSSASLDSVTQHVMEPAESQKLQGHTSVGTPHTQPFTSTQAQQQQAGQHFHAQASGYSHSNSSGSTMATEDMPQLLRPITILLVTAGTQTESSSQQGPLGSLGGLPGHLSQQECVSTQTDGMCAACSQQLLKLQALVDRLQAEQLKQQQRLEQQQQQEEKSQQRELNLRLEQQELRQQQQEVQFQQQELREQQQQLLQQQQQQETELHIEQEAVQQQQQNLRQERQELEKQQEVLQLQQQELRQQQQELEQQHAELQQRRGELQRPQLQELQPLDAAVQSDSLAEVSRAGQQNKPIAVSVKQAATQSEVPQLMAAETQTTKDGVELQQRENAMDRQQLYDQLTSQDEVVAQLKHQVAVLHEQAVAIAQQKLVTEQAYLHLEAALDEALATQDQSNGGPQHAPSFEDDECLKVLSPAEKALNLLDKMMHGVQVAMQEVLAVRNAILAGGFNLLAPTDLDKQVVNRLDQHGLGADEDVNASLTQMLASAPRAKLSRSDSLLSLDVLEGSATPHLGGEQATHPTQQMGCDPSSPHPGQRGPMLRRRSALPLIQAQAIAMLPGSPSGSVGDNLAPARSHSLPQDQMDLASLQLLQGIHAAAATAFASQDGSGYDPNQAPLPSPSSSSNHAAHLLQLLPQHTANLELSAVQVNTSLPGSERGTSTAGAAGPVLIQGQGLSYLAAPVAVPVQRRGSAEALHNLAAAALSPHGMVGLLTPLLLPQPPAGPRQPLLSRMTRSYPGVAGAAAAATEPGSAAAVAVGAGVVVEEEEAGGVEEGEAPGLLAALARRRSNGSLVLTEHTSCLRDNTKRRAGARRASVTILATAPEHVAVLLRQPSDMLNVVLAKAEDGWLFDAFQLAEASQGRPLSTLAFALLRRMHLTAHFQLSEARLARFLCAIEDGYPSNPYHCRTHAADVLRTVHCMMTRGKVGKMLGGDQRVDLLAVYLSALIHDFEHKGVNNQYLITTGDELALRYNDHSPMENHHIAAAFQLLLHDETNFFTNTNSKVREVIRRYVIELVLATDMKQHFAFNSMFNNKTPTLLSCIVGAHEAETSPVLMGAPSCRHPSLPGHGPELGKPLGEHPSPQVSGSLPTPPPLGSMGNKGQGVMDDDLRLLTLQMVMKVSDLGHLAHAKDVHRRWVQLLEEELFRQGDLEVAAGLPVSPLMDRTKAGVTRSQAGFFSLVCLPQLQAFTTVFSGCQPMLDQARENNQMWLEEARLQGEASPAPGLSGSPSRRYGPAVLPLMLSKADDGEEAAAAAAAPVTPAVVERAEGEEAGAAEGQRR